MKFITKLTNALLFPCGVELKSIPNIKQAKLVKRTRRQYKKQKQYTATTITLGKYKLSVSNIDSTTQMYTDIFVKETHNVKLDNNNTPLIYDLGSNIGITTLFYKELYPKAIIKAYEANPIVFKHLKKNIDNNNLTKVTANNQAISDKEDFLEFYCDKGGQVSSFFKPGNFKTEKVKIPTVRLKNLIDQESQQIDLIKMDIEGSEIDVLIDCGDSLLKVDRMVIEYHSYKGNKQQLSKLFNILETNDFRYIIKENAFSDFDLSNSDYKRSHFDMIIHIEAIKKHLL